MFDNRRKYVIPALALVCAMVLSSCGTPSLQGVTQQVQNAVGEAQDAVGEAQDALEGDHPLDVDSVSTDRYAYNQLDEETQKVYDEILYTFQNRAEDVQLATTDVDVMELAYQAIRYDYCDLFWVEQLSYVTYNRDDEIVSIVLDPVYSMTKEEQDKTQEQIDAAVDELLAGAPTDGTDYDKALYVYETLIQQVDYDVTASDNQNIISVFLNHKTICQGYAYGTQYLLEKLGIPCTTVTGTVDGENHAWNLVYMDGAYYYIDTTWGNSQFVYRDAEEGEETSSGVKYVDYDYFGATTESISETHVFDTKIPMPECTATQDNYYVHEGLYISEWDINRIGQLINNAYVSGSPTVQIKFATEDLYEQAAQYFIEDSHITDFCSGLDSIRYMENTGDRVLFLEFPGNE